ncbi:Zn-ribbon domain-containing OB-fold protein [Cupriavidus necator]|uniref:Zn-ribbon domain-containing OB-fold protein n=1 Tax=Cupriavidus necator TaxID=106590 RepID=UPI0005B3A2FC|nr:Zn-ribbon domain-containing OB-fold protein [Cupriavidus necator]
MQAALPKPVANADSHTYWNAARERRLVIRKCNACGQLHFMPRYLCPSCWSDNLDWIDASGTGRVHSFSVIRRASDPVFASRVPYVLALIELDEGPRMMANILGEDALGVAVGDPVTVTFEDRGDGALIPQFERIATRGA